MAKLAEITSETRLILKAIAAIAITFSLLFVIFFVGQFVIKTYFTPPPPPELEFGRLPSIQFPKQTPPALEYKINTLDGNLPRFPERMYVFKVKRGEPSIVALRNARSIVKSAGYTNNETKLNDAVYQWSDHQNRRIEYNILTNSFKIGSDYSGQSSVAEFGPRFANEEGAFKRVTDFLAELSEDTSDLDPEKTQLTYLKIDNGRIVMAESQNDAHFLRVDIFQRDLDKFPVYYPSPRQSTMYFVFKSESGFPNVSEANYLHYRIDTENVSDYYIKTAEQAFEDLKRGRAFIWIENANNKAVDITDVSLGYFVGEENQNFFMPIVVFKGNGFLAYVQAIPDELIQE
jgi:hypothetical protein